MSTAVYPRLENSFSFLMGGRTEFSKIGKNQLNQLEDQLGLKRGKVQRQLQDIVNKVTAEHRKLADKLENQMSTKVPNQIIKLINDRVKSLKFQKAIS